MEIIRHISQFVFQQNSYILIKKDQALIIDPGDCPEIFIAILKEKNVELQAIIGTHGHVDHVYAAAALCEKYSCPFIMSSQDQEWLDAVKSMCHQFDLEHLGTANIDHDISNKNELNIGEFSFKILHTPGHTPGCVCYYFDDILFSGDTLFYHSVGRTDLPRSNMDTLKKSVREKLFQLPDSTIVYPGHMEETTIGEEKRNNPFIIL